LLKLLTADRSEQHAQTVLQQLNWAQQIDTASLTHTTGLERDDVDSGLAWLAASGKVGFDLAGQTWFHRELPLDTRDALVHRNPRLSGARRLADAGAVSGGPATWHVESGDSTYVVTYEGRHRCTCTWEREHQGQRGPCKHILAVLLAFNDHTRL
jgi:hypothetical protein